MKPKKAIIHYVNQKNSNATIMNYVNQQMTMLEESDDDLTSDAVEIIFILKDKPTDTLIKTSHDLSEVIEHLFKCFGFNNCYLIF